MARLSLHTLHANMFSYQFGGENYWHRSSSAGISAIGKLQIALDILTTAMFL